MDIQLIFDNQFFLGDLSAGEHDLNTDEGLKTAVFISLFTDKRAIVEGEAQRGWWGDSYPEVEGDEIGSKLWLLGREKVMQDVRIRAKEYAQEALEWLKEDGLVKAVSVTIESPQSSRNDALIIKVALQIDSQTTHEFSYDFGVNNNALA